jgi:L-2-hydroxyglutarate oxidase LhgO
VSAPRLWLWKPIPALGRFDRGIQRQHAARIFDIAEESQHQGVAVDDTGRRGMELINAAGLGAQALARRIEGVAADGIPRQVLAKGSYFGCSGRPAFTRLIYPVAPDCRLEALGASRIDRVIGGVHPLDIGPEPHASGEVQSQVDAEASAPVEGGLGIHLTLDLAGRMRFGPDVDPGHPCTRGPSMRKSAAGSPGPLSFGRMPA